MKYIIPGKGLTFTFVIIVPDLDSFGFKIKHPSIDHMLIVETEKDVDAFMKKLRTLNAQYLIVADTAFWKKLVKKRKATGYNNYVLPCVLKGYDYLQVVYAPPPLLHDQQGFQDAVATAVSHYQGSYKEPGSPVEVTHLHDPAQIKDWLRTHLHSPLAADIETLSLKHWDSGIGSIAFATSPHHAVAFLVDLGPHKTLIRGWLKQWFEARNAWTLWHNATFDAYILTYQLWMKGLRDYEGMREGATHMTRGIECSKIQAYLALNSAQEIALNLKDLAQEFLGNWAVDDITDITVIPSEELLQYNGLDAAAAFWVHQKHYPTLVADQQQEIYETVLRPAMTDIIEMQLVGIPFSMKRVKRVHGFLTAFQAKALGTILGSPAAASTDALLAQRWADKRNLELKKKRVTPDDWPESFNVGSDQQLSVMLYSVMGLPVIETTKSGAPATDADTLKALTAHTQDPEILKVLSALLDWRDAQKLLTAFFPVLLSTPQAEDGWHYLCGNFNIGGTLSGRLSCVAEWTQVLTQRGPVPIRDLVPGDMAWTHKRRWRPITRLIKKPIEQMVDVCFSNGYVLTCTTAHRLKLPTEGWVTVQEIIDGRIQDVDGEPGQHTNGVGCFQGIADTNSESVSRGAGNQRVECEAGSPEPHAPSRILGTESVALLHLQGRGEESYEREIWSTTPQLDRAGFRREGVPDYDPQQRASVRAPCGDGCCTGNTEAAGKPGRTPHRQQSIEQQLGQPCLGDQGRAQDDSFIADDQRYGKITKINYRGPLQVWDISVEEDHSYWAEGCFSHNSSKPNLQNQPSTGARFSKVYKYMFCAPDGWAFVGADFNALEDRIDALKTRDPNKLRVFTDGFDGHSWRACFYFSDKIHGIDVTNPASVKTVGKLFPEERQKSKAPYFALTYQGTWKTLVKNCGFSIDEAKKIEMGHHEMYEVASIRTQEKVQEACRQGYLTVAFGLRVRAPLLYKYGTSLAHAQAEGRTIANAWGQSYNLLNTRSGTAFLKRVREEGMPVYPCAQIHDAQYFLAPRKAEIIYWVNTHLIHEMKWQELDEIRHPEVGLGGELDVFRFSWATGHTIPNNASLLEVEKVLLP